MWRYHISYHFYQFLTTRSVYHWLLYNKLRSTLMYWALYYGKIKRHFLCSETLRQVYSPLFEWRSHVKRFFWVDWVTGFGDLRLGSKRSKKWEKILYTFVRFNLNKQLPTNICKFIFVFAHNCALNLFFRSFLFWKVQVKRMDDMERSLETSLCRFLSHFLWSNPVTNVIWLPHIVARLKSMTFGLKIKGFSHGLFSFNFVLEWCSFVLCVSDTSTQCLTKEIIRSLNRFSHQRLLV